MQKKKITTTTMTGLVLLIASAVGVAPSATADHEDGHEVIEAGPVRLEITRLDGFQEFDAGREVMTPQVTAGFVGTVLVTFEDGQGADNTTVLLVAFGITDKCQFVRELPLVADCDPNPPGGAGFTKVLTRVNPEINDVANPVCVFSQRLVVSVLGTPVLQNNDVAKEVVEGPCPTAA